MPNDRHPLEGALLPVCFLEQETTRTATTIGDENQQVAKVAIGSRAWIFGLLFASAAKSQAEYSILCSYHRQWPKKAKHAYRHEGSDPKTEEAATAKGDLDSCTTWSRFDD